MLFLLVPIMKMTVWMFVLSLKATVLLLRGTWMLLVLTGKAAIVLFAAVTAMMQSKRRVG